MMTNFEIREKAREILKTNSLWLAIGLPLLVLNGISYYHNFASEGGSSLVYIISFIVGFWEVGVAGYVTNILTGKEKIADSFGEQIKAIFKNINGENVTTHLFVLMFLFLWALIPIAGIVIILVKSYSYNLAIYLSARKEASGTEAITISRRMMHGHKFDWFVLNFSFIGWLLLSVITLGLASIYVSPYILIANAVFANHVIDYSKREVK